MFPVTPARESVFELVPDPFTQQWLPEQPPPFQDPPELRNCHCAPVEMLTERDSVLSTWSPLCRLLPLPSSTMIGRDVETGVLLIIDAPPTSISLLHDNDDGQARTPPPTRSSIAHRKAALPRICPIVH